MIWIAAFLAALAIVPAESVEVATRNREVLAGDLLDLGSERVTLRVQEARRELDSADIVSLRWVGRQREKKTAQALAELWNGDLLRGSFQVLQADRFAMHPSSGTTFEIRLDAMRRLVFPKLAGTEDLAMFPSGEGKDRLYPKKTGSAFDFSNGTVEGFEKGQIAFRGANDRVEKFDLADIAALSLAPLETPPEEKGLLALFELGDGTRVTGKITALRGEKIEFQSPLLGVCTVETRDLLSIRFKNAHFRYLSEMKPIRVEQTTPFGADEPVLFPYQEDRSVGGRPLRVGGVEYFRGLGVHSRCVLVYALKKSYRTFRVAIGIDDEVLELPAKGSVVFRVSRDGKQVYESPIVRGGAAAISVPDIDVTGAEELTLEVDYADDLHVADRADWLDPMLIP